MGRLFIVCLLLVAGCSATPPATTVSTASAPVYRQPAYSQPAYRQPVYYPQPVFQPTYLDPSIYGRMYEAAVRQPPRVVVQQDWMQYHPIFR